jgi:hypothetical protein
MSQGVVGQPGFYDRPVSPRRLHGLRQFDRSAAELLAKVFHRLKQHFDWLFVVSRKEAHHRLMSCERETSVSDNFKNKEEEDALDAKMKPQINEM